MEKLGEKLGEGGEAEVFAIDERRVLRRFWRDHPSVPRRLALVGEISAGAGALDVAVPQVLDHGIDEEGRPWFEEVRLPGRSMTAALADVSGRGRSALFESYMETALSLRKVEIERPWFGELIAEEPLRRTSWSTYLLDALERQLAAADPASLARIDGLHAVLDDIRLATTRVGEPESSIVHFDYFPGNVMCDGRRITAVIDWSVLSIVGDPDLDVALADAYLGVVATVTAVDRAQTRSWLQAYGPSDGVHLYGRWGAAWWLPVEDDQALRRWVVGTLGDQSDRGPEP